MRQYFASLARLQENLLTVFDTGRDIITRQIACGQGPIPRQWIENHALFIHWLQPRPADQRIKLIWRDELVPIMRPLGQPPHRILSPNDRHHKTFGVPVQGGTNHQAIGFQQHLAGRQVSLRV